MYININTVLLINFYIEVSLDRPLDDPRKTEKRLEAAKMAGGTV